jgi:glutaminase
MLKFNNAAYIALKDKADGNYAQAFYMKERKSLPSTVELHACMDLYLQVTFSL